MNLFPYYSTEAAGVKKFIQSSNFNKVMKKNMTVMKTLINEADDLIVAWGGNSIGNKIASVYGGSIVYARTDS